MEELYLQNKELIEACADKLCCRFYCEQLREDLVSAGTIALLTHADRYNLDSGATISTFLYPYIVGAMKRELEHSLYPISLSKREFEGLRERGSLGFFSLEDYYDDSGEPVVQLPNPNADVERTVFKAIYLEIMEREFEKLSFKERQILGGFNGVFGFKMQTLAELGEEFDLTENAAAKAKDKAFKKLTAACMDGDIGLWKSARKAVKEAQREANLSVTRQACGGMKEDETSFSEA